MPRHDEISLLLDFDGTLVPIAETPEAVLIDQQLISLLERLATKLDGRLAVISGRDGLWLERHFGRTGAILVGNHGAEFLDDPQPRPSSLDSVSGQLLAFAATHPGVLVEEKRFGIALHFRQAPEAGAACVAMAQAIAEECGLNLQTGKAVIELRAAGSDKGTAVRAVMERVARTGPQPVFVGDDDTDEAAFSVVAELGGFGVLVGNPRPSAARFRLGDVSQVRNWLTGICDPNDRT
ncbi:hypothetical protein SZ64_02170 [Erythrobacter sp. SG61-1L]|nr:hypothetical protein SZ64_02170 [Erythrobacter sp. SG61-1L]